MLLTDLRSFTSRVINDFLRAINSQEGKLVGCVLRCFAKKKSPREDKFIGFYNLTVNHLSFVRILTLISSRCGLFYPRNSSIVTIVTIEFHYWQEIKRRKRSLKGKRVASSATTMFKTELRRQSGLINLGLAIPEFLFRSQSLSAIQTN